MGHTVPDLPHQLAFRSTLKTPFGIFQYRIFHSPICRGISALHLSYQSSVRFFRQSSISAVNDRKLIILRTSGSYHIQCGSLSLLSLYTLLALRNAKFNFPCTRIIIGCGRMIRGQGLRAGGHGLQLVDFGLYLGCQCADFRLGLVDFLFRRLTRSLINLAHQIAQGRHFLAAENDDFILAAVDPLIQLFYVDRNLKYTVKNFVEFSAVNSRTHTVPSFACTPPVSRNPEPKCQCCPESRRTSSAIP